MRFFYNVVLFYFFIIILAVFIVSGLDRPGRYAEARKYAAKEIENISLGSGRMSLNCPPVDLFETASKDANFVKNLQDLTLCGNFDRYSDVSLESFVNLESVTLVDTEDTISYLKVLPPNIKTLILDRTDLTSGTGTLQRVNDSKFRESLFQALTRFNSVEKIFINPWHKRLTSMAAKALPKLQALKKLDMEWAREEDVAILQGALPNCRVKLITDH